MRPPTWPGPPQAWDSFKGATTVKVCVIDTGIAYTHPDLQANVVGGRNSISNSNKLSAANDGACPVKEALPCGYRLAVVAICLLCQGSVLRLWLAASLCGPRPIFLGIGTRH
jgi:subtilisin family serine protease